MKNIINSLAAAVCLLSIALPVHAGKFSGKINFVERVEASGSSPAICYVGVVDTQVTHKPACAVASDAYFFSWNCNGSAMSLATSAYMGNRNVWIIGKDQCGLSPNYEDLQNIIMTDLPKNW